MSVRFCQHGYFYLFMFMFICSCIVLKAARSRLLGSPMSHVTHE